MMVFGWLITWQKKLKDNSGPKLRESDVKKALVGFRQTLRDIGALNDK